MKRTFIIATICVIVVAAMVVAGNVIIVAEKAAQICHLPWIEYVVYGLIAILFMWALVVPLVKIYRAPELPSLYVDEASHAQAVLNVGYALADNCAFIPDRHLRTVYRADLRRRLGTASGDATRLHAIVDDELSRRFSGDEELGIPGVNSRIRDWSTSVFLITAVSQNGRFDAISVGLMNFRMISDIVRSAGFRPGLRSMVRLYANVFFTALVTYSLQSALDDMDGVAPFDGLTSGDADADVAGSVAEAASDGEGGFLYSLMSRIRIPGVVVSSLVDGSANALMTLRIGYITRSYLLRGRKAFKNAVSRRAIKRQAMADALRAIPSIATNAATKIRR